MKTKNRMKIKNNLVVSEDENKDKTLTTGNEYRHEEEDRQ